ncbi:hypothetical protein LCL95_01085 [Bacillus timonensis]|nr:hypothetical protein [Bacillus timonensis]
MKKQLISFMSFLLLGIVGCGTSSGGTAPPLGNQGEYEGKSTRAEVSQGDFIYRLVSEEKEYKSGERIHVYAELEYVGALDEVTIYHAASPFYFPMTEKTRGYAIDYAMEKPLIGTVIKKGEPLREKYQQSGGYSSEDEVEYVEFMKNIMNHQFPVGYYQVNGYVEFFVEGQTENTDYVIKANVDFKVTN